MGLKISRRSNIAPFMVMEVMRAAALREAAGADVIHLEVGQPSTGAPEAVIAAARDALGADRLGYTDALGVPALRERIARFYRERYGVSVDPSRVVVTTGSSGAFLLAFLAAFDAGDLVAVSEPYYPGYRNILQALDVTPAMFSTGLESGFQPTLAQLERLADATAGLIIASPANPTGSMLSAQSLGDIAAWCGRRAIRLISDEIYHGITFNTPAQTALAVTEDAIVINSFSKYFSMTGWRLGWMVIPAELVRAVERLAQNLFISPPTLAQLAAIAAFDSIDQLDRNVARYGRNRDILIDGLARAGLGQIAPADGAFYVYADLRGIAPSSSAFCEALLREAGVAATPGIDFDQARGEDFVRFCFAGSEQDMREAVRRILVWRA
jgi:aspartate/methionine/tyrosine aminotransferase